MITEIRNFITTNEPPTKLDLEALKKVAENDKCICKLQFTMFKHPYTVEISPDVNIDDVYDTLKKTEWPI